MLILGLILLILGVVLNRADQAAVYHAYDYYGAYGASTAVEKVK